MQSWFHSNMRAMQPLRTLAKPGLHLTDEQYQHHHKAAFIINNKPVFIKAVLKKLAFFT